MRSMRVEVELVLLSLILLSIFTCTAGGVLCKEAEMEALLDFKLSFTSDPFGHFSSWSAHTPDCCTQWDGVECDDDTGHVVSLSVEQGLESHRLRPSLLLLQQLTYILGGLSWNNFTMSIPEFLGSLTNLEYLDLSNSGFNGKIPPHLGNLIHLQTLLLDGSPGLLYSDNLQWLPHLSSLQTLDLSGVNLSTAYDLFSSLKMLPSISHFTCTSRSFPLTPQPVEFEAFYVALVAGFAYGLFGVLGILHFHTPSRHAFFHMASQVSDWIFVWTMLCKCRIGRRLCFSNL